MMEHAGLVLLRVALSKWIIPLYSAGLLIYTISLNRIKSSMTMREYIFHFYFNIMQSSFKVSHSFWYK